VFRRDGSLFAAGYYDNVLIVNAFGFTIESAWETVLERAHDVRFSSRSFRVDGDRTDYPSSPLRRYEALRAIGLV